MRRRLWMAGVGTAAGALALTLALVVSVHASPPSTHPAPGSSWKVFGDASWTAGVGDNSKFGLVTTSDGTGTYGGIQLSRLPTTDPSSITALSFAYNPNVAGASGGSPRMVVQFSDGGDGELRPLTLAPGWSTVDGMSGNNWDANGGTCGFAYGTDWAGVQACHAGASITSVFVVNDSGWLYTVGEQITLDDVTVNSAVATGPGNNS